MPICHWLIKQDILQDPDCLFVWASKFDQTELIRLLCHHYCIKDSTVRLAAGTTTDATTLKLLVDAVRNSADIVKCAIFTNCWYDIWKDSFYNTGKPADEGIRTRETLMEIRPDPGGYVMSSALYFTCIKGDLKMTRHLLEIGVPASRMASYAMEYGSVELSDLLMKHGADIPSDDSFLTACRKQSSEFIRWLIDRFPNYRWPLDEGLVQASQAGNLQAVQILLEVGADPSANDNAASLLAVAAGRLDIYDLLRQNRLRGRRIRDESVSRNCST